MINNAAILSICGLFFYVILITSLVRGYKERDYEWAKYFGFTIGSIPAILIMLCEIFK